MATIPIEALRTNPTAVTIVDGTFPGIADYGLLSDCENTCLVAPSGAVEWLCLPRPHDGSVFGSILDRSGGAFRFGPAATSVPASRVYIPGTMVLETTWQTRTGWLQTQDFMAIGPWHRTTDRSALHRRTPSDFDAQHVLVRLATCQYGSVDLALDCQPSFSYGRIDAQWAYDAAAYGQVVTTNVDDPRLTLTSDLRLGIDGRTVRARHRLEQGESCFVSLSWSGRPGPSSAQQVHECLEDTQRFWRGWIDEGWFPDHPWREALQRSALTLKALTYAPTGALLAAPTTSLPERPGGHRNWDYRYAWVRDSALALWSLHALGFDNEADDFLAFLGDVVDSPADGALVPGRSTLRVMYAVDGADDLAEAELDHLTGHCGSRPVRIGNAANAQRQSDIFGSLVDCIYQHTRNRDALSERSWDIALGAVEAAVDCWAEPDQSIWETRSEPQHFTYSKIMCWVAADRGARLATLRGERELAEKWFAVAAQIHADVCTKGVDSQGRFTQAYGSKELDASLLMLPLVRFLPADDPRLRATVLGIADELTENGLVQRYRTDATDDGLNEDEASFTVCSFWLVSALAEIGEIGRATPLCERLLGAASGLGLYGEELDPATGRHLGNFPQALTHLALINAVLHVIESTSQRPIIERKVVFP